MCVTTYVAVIGLFLVSGSATSFPMSTLPSRAWRDLRSALSSPLAIVSILLLGAGAASAIASFPREAAATASASAATAAAEPTAASQAAAAASPEGLTPDQQAQLEKWYSAQSRTIVPIDPGGAAVLVVKFHDFQCPPCRQSYYDLKPVFEKYAKAAPGKVRIVVKHFPIDPECNAGTPNGSHLAACEAAAGMIMAGAGARADALESWLFGNQATLTGASVRTAAREIGGITDFDARYPKALEAVKADIALAGLMRVEATPSFLVNGIMIRGGMPAPYFDALVALELKKAGK
jgi:protein-disulfide isomerase